MISDTSHLFRQLKLAFCPNKEWEKKGAVGQEEEMQWKRRGDGGVVGWIGKQMRVWGEGWEQHWVKGGREVERVGRQNQG